MQAHDAVITLSESSVLLLVLDSPEDGIQSSVVIDYGQTRLTYKVNKMG